VRFTLQQSATSLNNRIRAALRRWWHRRRLARAERAISRPWTATASAAIDELLHDLENERGRR